MSLQDVLAEALALEARYAKARETGRRLDRPAEHEMRDFLRNVRETLTSPTLIGA